MPTNEAKFSIPIESNAKEVSEEASRALEGLRSRIQASSVSVKDMTASLKRLTGSTDEVKQAKTELTAKIAIEKTRISESTLAMLKAEKAAGALANKKKDAKLKTSQFGDALKNANGPLGSVIGRVSSLKDALGEGGAAGAMNLATIATVGLIAAFVAVGVAAVAAAASLAKFILTSADAARTAGLFREAAVGSALQAHNLGTQVDALADKIATPKAKINELAIALGRTRLTGQEMVDTLNAVGQASAAMGDEVGNQLKELVTRSQLTQRFFISPQELFGTGLEFQDVAAELAKQMKVGVKDAQMALFEGRVKLGDGAKALRAAIEKRFGDVNLKLMASLPVMAEKLKEKLGALTRDVKIEKLLTPLSKMLGLLDDSTIQGVALKKIITTFGNFTIDLLVRAMPIAKAFFEGLIIGALRTYIAWLKLKKAFATTFDTKILDGIITIKNVTALAEITVVGFALGVAALVGTITLGVQGVILFGKAIYALALAPLEIVKAIGALKEKIDNTDWLATGSSIVDGLIKGLKTKAAALADTVRNLADRIKNGFTDALAIHSPSRVFREYGKNTVKGYEQGIDSGASEAQMALANMSTPRSAPKSSGKSQAPKGGGHTFSFEINVYDSDKERAREVASTYRAQFQQMLEEILSNDGIGQQTPAEGFGTG